MTSKAKSVEGDAKLPAPLQLPTLEHPKTMGDWNEIIDEEEKKPEFQEMKEKAKEEERSKEEDDRQRYNKYSYRNKRNRRGTPQSPVHDDSPLGNKPSRAMKQESEESLAKTACSTRDESKPGSTFEDNDDQVGIGRASFKTGERYQGYQQGSDQKRQMRTIYNSNRHSINEHDRPRDRVQRPADHHRQFSNPWRREGGMQNNRPRDGGIQYRYRQDRPHFSGRNDRPKDSARADWSQYTHRAKQSEDSGFTKMAIPKIGESHAVSTEKPDQRSTQHDGPCKDGSPFGSQTRLLTRGGPLALRSFEEAGLLQAHNSKKSESRSASTYNGPGGMNRNSPNRIPVEGNTSKVPRIIPRIRIEPKEPKADETSKGEDFKDNNKMGHIEEKDQQHQQYYLTPPDSRPVSRLQFDYLASHNLEYQDVSSQMAQYQPSHADLNTSQAPSFHSSIGNFEQAFRNFNLASHHSSSSGHPHLKSLNVGAPPFVPTSEQLSNPPPTPNQEVQLSSSHTTSSPPPSVPYIQCGQSYTTMPQYENGQQIAVPPMIYPSDGYAPQQFAPQSYFMPQQPPPGFQPVQYVTVPYAVPAVPMGENRFWLHASYQQPMVMPQLPQMSHVAPPQFGLQLRQPAPQVTAQQPPMLQAPLGQPHFQFAHNPGQQMVQPYGAPPNGLRLEPP